MWAAHPFGRRGSAKKRFGGTPALFLAAIGGAEGFEAAIKGGEAKLTFAVSESARLRAGSSYTVVLDVTPANCATNVKPTQVKITVKVMK